MVLASSIGEIAHPFFILFAWLIERFYSLIPNYAIAIALLTLVVMIVVFPITRRSTRSMMKMQLLAPELKKIQNRYKMPPGTPVAERQQARQRLNEEMMALYRENNVSPTGGCLPMLLQLPIFWILYGTIRGLIHLKGFSTVAAAKAWCKHPVNGKSCVQPLYISHNSSLYHAVIHANGKLMAFGINMADSVRSAGLTWAEKAPLVASDPPRDRPAVHPDQADQRKERCRRGRESADAADAEGHADHLRCDLHRDPRWRERLLHRVEPVPHRAAGVHVPAGPTHPGVAVPVERPCESRPSRRHDPGPGAAEGVLRAVDHTSGGAADGRRGPEGDDRSGGRSRRGRDAARAATTKYAANGAPRWTRSGWIPSSSPVTGAQQAAAEGPLGDGMDRDDREDRGGGGRRRARRARCRRGRRRGRRRRRGEIGTVRSRTERGAHPRAGFARRARARSVPSGTGRARHGAVARVGSERGGNPAEAVRARPRARRGRSLRQGEISGQPARDERGNGRGPTRRSRPRLKPGRSGRAAGAAAVVEGMGGADRPHGRKVWLRRKR